MARIKAPKRRANEREYDEFYETIAPPVAARPYYDETIVRPFSPAEQLIRVVAGILNLLLALRFVLAIFTSNMENGFVAVLYNATNWLVAPFQTLFGAPASGGGGYFDLPALAAIVFVSVIAWIFNMIVRLPEREA